LIDLMDYIVPEEQSEICEIGDWQTPKIML
jgi:hypothetical protein